MGVALDLGHDVHDRAVAFDAEALDDLDRAGGGDAADVIATEVQQHQVF